MDTGTTNQQKTIMVSIFCMVYNHEPYIRKCLEGFLMQECNFDYQIVIGEDYSTDNSRAIILEYANKYPAMFKLLLHENNVGAAENQRMVFENCKGKYIAMCEGDDYWTDPLKLQKQVDFLEANPDYGLVHTNTKMLNQRTQKFIERVLGRETESELESKELFYAILNSQYIVSTLTVLFRSELLKHVTFEEKFKMGDVPLWLQLSQKTKFKYLNEITSVYRAAFNSATRQLKLESQLLFLISGSEMRIFYSKKYGISIQDKVISEYRRRIFELKNYKLNTVNVSYPEFFSKEELHNLNKKTNYIKYIFRKIKFYANNYKHCLFQIYWFFAKK